VVDGIWAVHQDDPAKRSDGRSGLPIVRRSVATVGEGLPPDGGGDRRHNDDAETDRQTATGRFPSVAVESAKGRAADAMRGRSSECPMRRIHGYGH
jgi:hypothetical protein